MMIESEEIPQASEMTGVLAGGFTKCLEEERKRLSTWLDRVFSARFQRLLADGNPVVAIGLCLEPGVSSGYPTVYINHHIPASFRAPLGNDLVRLFIERGYDAHVTDDRYVVVSCPFEVEA